MKVMMVGLLPADLREVRGGVVSVILNLLEGFRSCQDAEVVHVSFNPEIRRPFRIRIAGNISVHYLPFRSEIALIDYFLNRENLKQIYADEKPDIIHIQEVTPHLIRFLGWPDERIVITQHGIMQAEYRTAEGWRSKAKSVFKGLVERFYFPLFRNIIFISGYNQSLFPGKAKHAARIFNPVHPQFFSINTRNKDPRRILYAGVLNRNKNVGLLIQAISLLRKSGREFRVDVAGGFKDPRFEEVLQQQIDRSGCEDLFTFHGWQSQQELANLHQHAAVLVLTSLQENMPVCIAESMAAGTLVVASDVGAVNEMITDGTSGILYPSDDLDALCFILKNIWDNPQLIPPMAAAARQEAQEKFNPVRVARQTLGFYKRVNGNHSPA